MHAIGPIVNSIAIKPRKLPRVSRSFEYIGV